MYDKINMKRKNLMSEKNIWRAFFLFALIGLISVSITMTKYNGWSDFFVYPEDDYKLSENAAEEIAKNEDVLSESFKSEHEVIITLYDKENKLLRFDVQATSSSRSVHVSIENYRESNQKFTITRNQNNLGPTGFYISGILVMIIVPALLGIILLIIYILILNLFCLLDCQ